jgi:methionyl-tRNA formyltransferase
MRFGFVTCVELGQSCMEEIYATGARLDLVVTLPDDKARKKSGRIYPDAFCAERDIPLVKTGHINDAAAINAIRAHGIDWLFIIGWSQIAGEAVLSAPLRGALGMHPTLLPEGRGRAAIPWAIIKGLSRTGVTLFRLAPGVDTGAIAAQIELPIAADETATTLYRRVNDAHRALIREAIPRLVADSLPFTPQDESRASYWPGRTPADGRIQPSMRVEEVDRLVRATTRPYPGAFTDSEAGILRIWRGRAGNPAQPAPSGAFRLTLSDGVYDATEWEREG